VPNAREVKVISEIMGSLQIPINVGNLLIHSLNTGKIYRVGDEDQLEKALEYVEPFDTIILEDGTYNISLEVKKPLTIIGSKSAILQSENVVINVPVDVRVNLVGFKAVRNYQYGSVINYWGRGKILGLTIEGGSWGIMLAGMLTQVLFNVIQNFSTAGISLRQSGHFIGFNTIISDGSQYKEGMVVSPGVSAGNIPGSTALVYNSLINIFTGIVVSGTVGLVVSSNIISAIRAGVVLTSAPGIQPVPSSGTKVVYNTIFPYGTTLDYGIQEQQGQTKSNFIAGNTVIATNPIVVYDQNTVQIGNVFGW